MSYLVIGGCGFLGRHIVDLLLERGEPNVSVFDLVLRDADLERWGKRVTAYSEDLTDETVVKDVIRKSGATSIIQTASAIQGAPRSVHLKVNVFGMQNIINAALELGIQRLVYTSTASVVFDGSHQNNIDETLPYPECPFDDYNETKAIAEQAVLKANGQGALKTTSLRVAGLFGTRDLLTVSGMMAALVEGKHTVQMSYNDQKFDWTFIVNAARAHILAVDRLDPTHPQHHLVAGEAFFITNASPMGFWDLPRSLWTEALRQSNVQGSLPAPTVIPYPAAYIIASIMEIVAWFTGRRALLTRFRVAIFATARWCNIDKAKKALNYDPQNDVPVQEGIRQAVEWWLGEHPEFKVKVKTIKLA